MDSFQILSESKSNINLLKPLHNITGIVCEVYPNPGGDYLIVLTDPNHAMHIGIIVPSIIGIDIGMVMEIRGKFYRLANIPILIGVEYGIKSNRE